MPNHVKTMIHLCDISDEKFKEIADKFTREDKFYNGKVLDFEKIIPMPDTVYRGDLGAEEELKYGKDNWYDWSIKNWGTKWNAYDGYVDYIDHNLVFTTAWCFAEPVIKKLSEILKCDIVAFYADEDYGYNVGQVLFKQNGEIVYSEIIEDSDDAWAIVELLWNVSKEEFLKEMNNE